MGGMKHGPFNRKWVLLAVAACAALWIAGFAAARFAVRDACQGRTSCLLEGSLTLQQSFKFRIVTRKGAPELRVVTHRARDYADNDGMVVWTLGNFSWLDFVLNWVANVRAAGIEYFFVGCLDNVLEGELLRRGIPAVRLPIDLGVKELMWGSDIFKQRGREKIKFIRSMTLAGLQPVFSDLDVVWLRNPIPYLKQFPEAHILTSLDLLGPTKMDGSLEPCPDVLGAALLGMQNVGIHLMREGALPALNAWLLGMEESTDMEQVVFNGVMAPSLRRADGDNPYCSALEDRVMLGLLPPSAFANGHLYYTQGLAEWEDLVPGSIYAVHATFVLGTHSKRHYMRERKLWKVDKPSRFAPPEGFMTFDIEVPEELLRLALPPPDIGPDFLTRAQAEGHIQLMLHQFSQLRVAMQIALALRRELIVPPVLCALDYGWSEHNGRVAGTRDYKLPFNCPLGKVLDLERWAAMVLERRLPQFHEQAILEHPLLANASRVVVSAGPPLPAELPVIARIGPFAQRSFAENNSRLCSPENAPQRPPCEVVLSQKRSAEDLQRVLARFAGIQILHFPDVRAVWGGASDRRFEAAVDNLALSWCCSAGNERVPLRL